MSGDQSVVPRRPLLPATFRGVSAVWLRRRLAESVDLASAPADLARAANSEQAGRALAYSLAELDEACRQWEERVRARQSEAGSGAGTAEQPESGSLARSGHELTTTEAAALLGVSDGIVRRWCREGRVRARRSGGSWLIDSGSVGDLRDARRGAA
ncbi:helix-turn-helix domain-containing protein [Janibacter melonis]|uniref:helix-turn-helix domain-containing protein n=1 Tax=Janibacter melonis TaxID=262209 RepID=UPI003B972EDB